MTAGWDHARAVADAVLYEGYLLYPYRANSRKNQSRWQFGVLGPQGAADTGIGEDDTLSSQVLVRSSGVPSLSGVVRFLQLQHRRAERDVGGGRFEQVDELTTGSTSWLSWDEAVEREIPIDRFPVTSLPRTLDISVPAGTDIEDAGWWATGADASCATRSTRHLRGSRWRTVAALVRGAQCRATRRRQRRGDRDLADRHASAHRSHRRRIRIPAGTAGFRRRSGGAVQAAPLLPGACGASRSRRRRHRAEPRGDLIWCRRSSSTTIPRSPNRARARCTTPPRSTRSSRCGS